MVKRNDLNLEPAVLRPAPNLAFDNTGQQLEAKAKVESLMKVNSEVNQWADREAILAGTTDGLKAGMTPNFKPTHGTGLYSQAFDRAGLDTYANEVEIKANADAARIFKEHKQDPVTLQKALSTSADASMSSLPDEVKPRFKQLWAAKTLSYLDQARQIHEAKVLDQYKASTIGVIDQGENNIYSAARTIENDEQAAAAIAVQMASLHNQLSAALPHDVTGDMTKVPIYTEEQKAKKLQDIEKNIFIQRALGKLERAQDKEGFMKNFEAATRKEGKFSPEVIDDVATKMRSIINREDDGLSKARQANYLDLQKKLDLASSTKNLELMPTPEFVQSLVDQKKLSDTNAYEITKKIVKANEEIQKYQVANKNVDAALSSGLSVDSKDKVQVEAVNDRYTSMMANAQFSSPLDANDIKARFAGQVGMIPKPLAGEISSGLRSNNPEAVMQAVDLVNRLEKQNPRVKEQINADDLNYHSSISAYVASGFQPVDAITKARELMNVPPAQKAARAKDFKTLVEASPSKSWIEGQENRWFSADPEIDSQMTAEFENVTKALYQETGNLEGSRKTALNKILSVWSRTNVGKSEQQWGKYAPEKFYGDPNLDDEQNAKWMNEQLLSGINANNIAGKTYTLDDLIVTPDPTVKTPDGRPGYRVSIIGDDGAFYKSHNGSKVWIPDANSSSVRKKLLGVK